MTSVQRTVLVVGRDGGMPARLYPADVDGSMAIVVIAVGWPLTDAQRQIVEDARALAREHRLPYDALLVSSFREGVAEISNRDRVLLAAGRREGRRVRRLLRPRSLSATDAR